MSELLKLELAKYTDAEAKKAAEWYMAGGGEGCYGIGAVLARYAKHANANDWVAITCEDDLPKESGNYLVTSRWTDEDGSWHVCEDRWMAKCWEREVRTLSSLEVIAYRPLPAPYSRPVEAEWLEGEKL